MLYQESHWVAESLANSEPKPPNDDAHHSNQGLSHAQLMIIYASLIIVILLYFLLLCFIAFNFYRIMIK